MYFDFQDSARTQDNPGEAAPKTEKTAIRPGVYFSFRKKKENLEIFRRSHPFMSARRKIRAFSGPLFFLDWHHTEKI